MITKLRQALSGRTPRALQTTEKDVAAVAMLLQEDENDLQVLFIERVEREGDPWSGHIAFPGGRLQDEVESPQAAAERETREEIGIDLTATDYLGRLDDLTGNTLPVQVSGFVYLLSSIAPKPNDKVDLLLNHEVRDAFWYRFSDLVDPKRHRSSAFLIDDAMRQLPSIELDTGRPLLWGLTYRFIMQLVHELDIEIAGGDP